MSVEPLGNIDCSSYNVEDRSLEADVRVPQTDLKMSLVPVLAPCATIKSADSHHQLVLSHPGVQGREQTSFHQPE